MPTGISLHLGLNNVDPAHYKNIDPLKGPRQDAKDMEIAAQGLFGYQTTKLLLDEEATSAQLVHYVLSAAENLVPNDIFLLTYSGHGSLLQNAFLDDSDEEIFDQTWCLYDRQFLDDELSILFSRFRAGVRILVISDSCYSGSITKNMGASFESVAGKRDRAFQQAIQQVMDQLGLQNKALPQVDAEGIRARNLNAYNTIQQALVGSAKRPDVSATVKLFSASQELQPALDGEPNSQFTAMLMDVFYELDWAYLTDQKLWTYLKGTFSFPTPNYHTYGQPHPTWDKRFPFSV